MRLRDVNVLTEDQGKNWSKFIQSQKSLLGFIEGLEDWDGLVSDAEKIIRQWKPQDFEDFKKCIALEKRGIFSGEENARKFAAIMMPELMFKASIVADQFKVPWGLSVKRLVEADPIFEELKTK